eukprot:2118290-Heterocapsa_arctica.AAC.1
MKSSMLLSRSRPFCASTGGRATSAARREPLSLRPRQTQCAGEAWSLTSSIAISSPAVRDTR